MNFIKSGLLLRSHPPHVRAGSGHYRVGSDARSHAEMAHISKGDSMYLVEGVHFTCLTVKHMNDVTSNTSNVAIATQTT